MTSDKPDRIESWDIAIGSTQTLTATAFAEMVAQNGLRVVGPIRGYYYCFLGSEEGHTPYRTYAGAKWLWQSRIVFTQTNAAGGAIVADYSTATGQYAELVMLRAINSGTNDLNIKVYDEDNADASGLLAAIASGAGTNCALPSIGASAGTSNHIANSVGLKILPGQKLSVYQTGAGAQNDTLTIGVALMLYNLDTEPTISKARSTNAADVTQGTDSISDANDLQEVLHWF